MEPINNNPDLMNRKQRRELAKENKRFKRKINNLK